MILGIEHADRLQRHIQSQIGAREMVEGVKGLAPVFWRPTADPREIVRRQEFLEALGSDHLTNGNVLHTALSAYVQGLAVELALEVRR